MATPTQAASKTLRANSLELHYLEWGKPEAAPIVCVHGFTSSAETFNALALAVGRGHTGRRQKRRAVCCKIGASC